MDQTNAILEELTRNGRLAYRQLVRAGAPKSDHGSCAYEDPTAQMASIKKQLQVGFRLASSCSKPPHGRAVPFEPLRWSHISRAFCGLNHCAPNKQRPVHRPPPEIRSTFTPQVP